LSAAFKEAVMKLSLSLAPRSLAAAVVALALAAPAAMAGPADQRTPGTSLQTQATDLRSPDARDAATPRRPLTLSDSNTWPAAFGGSMGHVDPQVLASRGTPTRPTKTAAPQVRSTDDGFDWGSAGIGAAVTGGLILIAIGAFGAAYRARVRLAR
jgi:hypothetical protein